MLEVDSACLQSATTMKHSPGVRDAKSLRRAVEALVMAHPGVRRMPDGDVVHEVAFELGLQEGEFCALDVAMGRRRFSIVCIPSRMRRLGSMEIFFELKALAATIGRAVVLVPERFVRREPRLGNSMLIAGSAGSSIRGSDRMAILGHLLEQGGCAPLSDLAALVKSDDPVSAVLSLIVDGALFMDLDKRILPGSDVHLVEPSHE